MQRLKELWAKWTAPRYYPKWCRVLHQIVWWMNLVNIPLNVLGGAFFWALISIMWCVVFGCFIEQSRNFDKLSENDKRRIKRNSGC